MDVPYEDVEVSELDVVDAMAERGGGFVKALANCFYKADLVNFQILKSAFPVYWGEYTYFAKRNKAEKNGK